MRGRTKHFLGIKAYVDYEGEMIMQNQSVCPTCRRAVQPGWKKCPYCKTSLAVEENYEEKILAYITAHQGTISISQCARELGCSEDDIREGLMGLEQKGRLAKTPPKPEAIQYQVQPPYQPAQPAYQPPPQYPQQPQVPPPYQPPAYQPKPKKSHTGIIIVAVLAIVVLLVLAGLGLILYVWVSGFSASGVATPQVSLGSATVAPGKQDINWTIVAVSRADIKWADVSATVSLNGVSTSATVYVVIYGTSYELSSYTGTEYVTAAHTIHVHLGSAASSGARVDLTLMYDPTASMMGTSYTTVI